MPPLRILQVSTADAGGGAERVALNLHRAFRARGHHAELAVGDRRVGEPGVLHLDNDAARSAWARWWLRLRRGDPRTPAGRATLAMAVAAGQPRRFASLLRGREDFDMPATARLLELARGYDVVHCHNLHGGYFDLRLLPRLASEAAVFLTLHDMWMLTGHCAYSLGCSRWQDQCGDCPHLSVYPPLFTDGTAFNLRRKREIFSTTRVRVAAPSRWLLDQVAKSVLAPAVIDSRVIRLGVDLAVFRPADRSAAREALGLPHRSPLVLFAANSARSSPFKDFTTLVAAARRIALALRSPAPVFAIVGEEGPPPRLDAPVRVVPRLKDPAALARWYQAADVFLHAARDDNFPNTVLEAQACGTAVVATAVGGVPEQIEEGRTGLLVPPGDPQAMAAAALSLLTDAARRASLAAAAAEHASRHFSLDRQADEYLAWFAAAT